MAYLFTVVGVKFRKSGLLTSYQRDVYIKGDLCHSKSRIGGCRHFAKICKKARAFNERGLFLYGDLIDCGCDSKDAADE